MTMIAGSVDRTTIDATTGSAGTSSGLAGYLYAAKVAYNAALSPPVPRPAPTLHQTTSPFSPSRPADATDVADGMTARLTTFQTWADELNVIAQAIAYIKTNGAAQVTVQKLGRIPSGLTAGGIAVVPAGADIDFPAATVLIPLD